MYNVTRSFVGHRPQKIVWHGSDASGESAVDGSCDAWNSESAEKRGRGSALVSPRTSGGGGGGGGGVGGHHARLLDQRAVYDCRNYMVVLCVETTPHTGAMFSRKRRDHDGPDHRDTVDGVV